MIDEKFKVDIRPDVAALRIFRSMSFTPWYALGEFVDNSITSSIKKLDLLKKLNGPDYELSINIDFDKENDSLTITDNAAGINRHEIERALRTGIPPSDTSLGLSKHGVGMKAAALWWGRTLTIETYPIEEPNGWRAVIDISDSGDLDNYIEVSQIPSRGYPGTKIRVAHLWRKTPQAKTITAIRAYLPSIYRSYLNPAETKNGFKCKIIYEGKELTFAAPELLVASYWSSKDGPDKTAKPVKWELPNIDIELSSGIHVTGSVGILKTMNRNYSGFFLHYRGKGISGVVPIAEAGEKDLEEAKDAISRASYKPNKIFGQPGSYRWQSFVGEFDITDFGKTITTDSVLWAPQDEAEFIDKLHDLMGKPEMNFLKMAENVRRNSDSFDKLDNVKSDAQEAKFYTEAFDTRLSHADARETNDEIIRSQGIADAEEQDELEFPFTDQEMHLHKFKVKLVRDRSQDFITIAEDRSTATHHVRINQYHSCLDGITMNSEVRKTLQRLGVGLAMAEVMLTDSRKKMIRDKMNEILRQLQSPTNG